MKLVTAVSRFEIIKESKKTGKKMDEQTIRKCKKKVIHSRNLLECPLFSCFVILTKIGTKMVRSFLFLKPQQALRQLSDSPVNLMLP